MSINDYKPDYMPWISCYLTVKDANKALDFYKKAFNFSEREQETQRDADGRVLHAAMHHQDSLFMLGSEGAYGSKTQCPRSLNIISPVKLYVYCSDVDTLFKQAIASGAEKILAPEDTFWGDRMCTLRDPDGHLWNFATKIADFDPATAQA